MTRKLHKTLGSHSQPYQYDELPCDGSFRCLILHRGTGNDPLTCSLQTASLSKTKFEAISYVWGKSKKNKKIICDGRVVKITKSLSNVLRRLRLPHSRRKLWADGICINQDDLSEKGHQVAIMGEIYRSAKRVLIYIGSDDGGYGPQLCALLEHVDQMINETFEQMYVFRNSFPYPEKDDPILFDSRWKSLLHLFRQDWFKRGWVVREAAFAQYGLVIWHQSEFSWEKLMRIFLWLSTRAHQVIIDNDLQEEPVMCHREAFRVRNKAFAQAFFEEPARQPLLETLNDAKVLRLSDPRDRIYAFTELSEDAEWLVDVQPDYNLAPLEVYRRFAMQYMRETKVTRILDFVAHGLEFENPDIPSWIPRWDIDGYSLSSFIEGDEAILSSRDGSFREPEIISHGVISVQGVVTDEVRYVSDTFELDSPTLQTVAELWNAISHVLEDSPYKPSHRLYVFLDALCSDIQAEVEALVSSKTSGQEYRPLKTGGGGSPYFEWVTVNKSDRRFIVTKHGYMGLAPAVTQKDDLCAIIFGCKTPCILRPTAQEQHYKFLGATCLMGKRFYEVDGNTFFTFPLGHEISKDWVEWDVQEQDIYLN